AGLKPAPSNLPFSQSPPGKIGVRGLRQRILQLYSRLRQLPTAAGLRAAPPEQMLFQAHRLEQLGRLSEALALYRQAATALPNSQMAQVRPWRLARDLRTPPSGAVTVIWQFDPQKSWEREWVRYLLSGLSVTEIVDGSYREFRDAAIVVDNVLNPAKRAYYFEMLMRGHRFGLFHLSDECYTDDCAAYEFA